VQRKEKELRRKMTIIDDIKEIGIAVKKIDFMANCLYDIQEEIRETKPRENLAIVIEILRDYILTVDKEIDRLNVKYIENN